MVSPHLDDGVLSLGGSIHKWTSQGDRATILTLFAGTRGNRSGGRDANWFLRRQLDLWGINQYDERLCEDSAAAHLIGAVVSHVDMPELLLREEDAHSIGELLARAPVRELADQVVDVVVHAAADHDIVYLPSGRSGHPDHVLAAATAVQLTGAEVVLYEEIPYCLAHSPEFEPSWFTRASLLMKLNAVKCYRSQIAVLFGGEAEMRAALTGRARGFGAGYAEGVRHVRDSSRTRTRAGRGPGR